MSTRTVFSDDDSNELDCFINDAGKLYISIHGGDPESLASGFITLDKEDVDILIKTLQGLVIEME